MIADAIFVDTTRTESLRKERGNGGIMGKIIFVHSFSIVIAGIVGGG